jgi:hypothetical protein
MATNVMTGNNCKLPTFLIFIHGICRYSRDYQDLKTYLYSMGRSGDATAVIVTDEQLVREKELIADEAAGKQDTSSTSSSSSMLSISRISDSLFSKSSASNGSASAAVRTEAISEVPATEVAPGKTAGMTTVVSAKGVVTVPSNVIVSPASVVSVQGNSSAVVASAAILAKPAKPTRPVGAGPAAVEVAIEVPDESSVDGGVGVQAAVNEGVSALIAVLVPAGKIVHLYNVHGEYRAAEITHRHASLQRIMLLDDRYASNQCYFKLILCNRSVGDHDVDNICGIIRRIKLRYSKTANIFLVLDMKFNLNTDYLVAKRGASKIVANPVWQSIRTPVVPVDQQAKVESAGPCSTVSVLDPTDGGNYSWTRCCVCELDPQWLYIFKGDMNRGRTVHNCRF